MTEDPRIAGGGAPQHPRPAVVACYGEEECSYSYDQDYCDHDRKDDQDHEDCRLPPYLRRRFDSLPNLPPTAESPAGGSPSLSCSSQSAAAAVARRRPRLWVDNPSVSAAPKTAAHFPAATTAEEEGAATGSAERKRRWSWEEDGSETESEDDDGKYEREREREEALRRPSKVRRRLALRESLLGGGGYGDCGGSFLLSLRRRTKATVVAFADPPVTETRTRPRTPPEDVAALFYSPRDERRFRAELRRERLQQRRIEEEEKEEKVVEEEEAREEERDGWESSDESEDESDEGEAEDRDRERDDQVHDHDHDREGDDDVARNVLTQTAAEDSSEQDQGDGERDHQGQGNGGIHREDDTNEVTDSSASSAESESCDSRSEDDEEEDEEETELEDDSDGCSGRGRGRDEGDMQDRDDPRDAEVWNDVFVGTEPEHPAVSSFFPDSPAATLRCATTASALRPYRAPAVPSRA